MQLYSRAPRMTKGFLFKEALNVKRSGGFLYSSSFIFAKHSLQ